MKSCLKFSFSKFLLNTKNEFLLDYKTVRPSLKGSRICYSTDAFVDSHTIRSSSGAPVVVDDAPDPGVLSAHTEFLDMLRLRPLTTESAKLDTSGNASLDYFIGDSQDLGFPNMYGGQLLAQSLQAACLTVDENRPVHSMHGYFLVPGDAKIGVRYEVDRVRDGATFNTRRVVARQKGKALFSCAASFQKDEKGFEHQYPKMPDVPPPEDLINELDVRKAIQHHLPPRLADLWTRPRPVDIRYVKVVNILNPTPRAVWPPLKNIWIKTVCPLPDDCGESLHRVILTYLSDFFILTAALLPHQVSALHPKLAIASLDHSIFFHRPFRVDDWLLYTMSGPISSGTRGFTTGHIYTRDGVLIASVFQEGLIRMNTASDNKKEM